MKYPTGDDVQLGDRVELWSGCVGVVVAVIDRDEFGPNYPKADWQYLKSGVLIDSDKAGESSWLQVERSGAQRAGRSCPLAGDDKEDYFADVLEPIALRILPPRNG
jgi:hypothetical protein